MRRLLRDFADRAGTVLLSSHLLREVEKTADQLVVINKGRVVAQGATGDMLVDGVDLEDLFLSLLAEGASL
jgi:ABC-2 type transport system ATP-binding protein